MLTEIVAKLKTGRITNVVPFGSNLPNPPYIVVKPESAPNGCERVRVIVHMRPGQQTFLRSYIFGDLSDLLSEFQSVTGNINRLDMGLEYSDIIANNDDGTISAERVFYAPRVIF